MVVVCWLEDSTLFFLEARHSTEHHNVHCLPELALHFYVFAKLFVLLKFR
jgi:hypothetical protein